MRTMPLRATHGRTCSLPKAIGIRRPRQATMAHVTWLSVRQMVPSCKPRSTSSSLLAKAVRSGKCLAAYSRPRAATSSTLSTTIRVAARRSTAPPARSVARYEPNVQPMVGPIGALTIAARIAAGPSCTPGKTPLSSGGPQTTATTPTDRRCQAGASPERRSLRATIAGITRTRDAASPISLRSTQLWRVAQAVKQYPATGTTFVISEVSRRTGTPALPTLSHRLGSS